jgi:hypothetical protein
VQRLGGVADERGAQGHRRVDGAQRSGKRAAIRDRDEASRAIAEARLQLVEERALVEREQPRRLRRGSRSTPARSDPRPAAKPSGPRGVKRS